MIKNALRLLALASISTAATATEIDWWHAMGGALGERVGAMAADYNARQDQCVVNAVYKGSYTENMTAGIAAFRSQQPPHILQVFEVGTATMMAAEGAIKPVYQLLEQYGKNFDPSAYLASVVGYYATPDGKMLSLPFNSSTPILFYNKDAFKKAGLDPDTPPQTWPEVGEFSAKLKAAGYECGFSSAWPSWIQLENLAAWHNIPIGSQANGFGGLDTEFLLNSDLHNKHISQLATWIHDKTFVYGGRRDDSRVLFTSGQCPIYMQSSAGYAAVKDAVDFEFGTGMLPYWPDVKGAPQNSIIGGATLWVFEGHSDAEYACVADFFSYLSAPDVQAKWHQDTGYLPITYAAYELTKKQGFYTANPGTETALLQMTLHEPTENSRGLRFGNFVQIRDVLEEELEAVWSGAKTTEQALDDMVKRGNQLLRRFERTRG